MPPNFSLKNFLRLSSSSDFAKCQWYQHKDLKVNLDCDKDLKKQRPICLKEGQVFSNERRADGRCSGGGQSGNEMVTGINPRKPELKAILSILSGPPGSASGWSHLLFFVLWSK